MKQYLLILFTLLLTCNGFAQTIIKGYVYQDKYRTPLDSVIVYTQSGHLSTTDSTGNYTIRTGGLTDSIWFQFKDKLTHKYPIDTIRNPQNFEVQIYLPKGMVQTPKGYLPTVTVHSRNYYFDSLQLRRDYAKTFDYKKPSEALGESVAVTPTGIGVDMDAVINLFRFGYNKRQLVYQKFALQIEQDRYVDHRFTKKLVEEITGLYDKERDDYMLKYRPEYNALLLMNELQLGKYIQITYKKYLQQKENSKVEKNIFLPPYDQKHPDQE